MAPTAHKKTGILIIDDQYHAFRSLPRLISPDIFSTTWVPNEHHGLKILKEQTTKAWIIIIDLKSSGMGGGGFLRQARQISPKSAILITAPLGSFLCQGGTFYDYSGPSLKQDIDTILFSIRQRMRGDDGLKENRGHQYECKDRFGVIIGRSKPINEIYRLIEKLRESNATVLIQGESGTGKELIAQTIHKTGRRKNRSFVAVNCGAIPANLMESELFGHERGAFTTAVQQRKGKFEIAHGGTLFLDEIGELERELQVKLLRVLQEKEFQRVGGNRSYKTDVRIIAATSQDVKQAVQTGHFRDDLFYRLNVVPIHIPPLRERREDIPLLLEHFSLRIAKEMDCSVPSITAMAKGHLVDYSYPGNVRELTNIIERLLVTCPNGKIAIHDLPREVYEEAAGASETMKMLKELPDGGIPLRKMEKELILKTLNRTSWNKTAAARMLGITRRLLYSRLSSYGLSSH